VIHSRHQLEASCHPLATGTGHQRRAVHISVQGLYCLCKPVFCNHLTLTGYPLHSLVFPSLLFLCVTVCHHISTGLYHLLPICLVYMVVRIALSTRVFITFLFEIPLYVWDDDDDDIPYSSAKMMISLKFTGSHMSSLPKNLVWMIVTCRKRVRFIKMPEHLKNSLNIC
jgi:hypothetical protein